MIGWQSLPDSMINNAGKVMFHDALGGKGTELEVVIIYHAPAGELGAGVAKLLNPVLEKLIRQDVMNFKEYIETKHTSPASNDNTPSMHANPSNQHTNPNPNILRTESESVAQGESKTDPNNFRNP